MRKYFLNESYFEIIDTAEKAYWLGFLYADGNIYKNIFCVNLAYCDVEHNNKLKTALSYEGVLYVSTSNFNTKVSRLQIGSKRIVQSLKLLGFTENKSLTISPPFISPAFTRDFWRGVFDGDGEIGKIRNKIKKEYTRIRLTGNMETIRGFQTFLEKTININCGIIRPHGQVFRIEYNKQKIVKQILNYLYSNSSVFLERKYKSFSSLESNV